MNKIRLIIMSHLSDLQANPTGELNNTKINFIKYLLLNYKDINIVIDADTVFNEFIKKHPHLVP
jgi:hypothetical protein